MIGPAVLLIEETLQESILRPQKLSLLLLKFAPITCIYYILLHIETLQAKRQQTTARAVISIVFLLQVLMLSLEKHRGLVIPPHRGMVHMDTTKVLLSMPPV